MAITSEIVNQFKDRMHIDGDEDDNLQRILESSETALKRMCGDYDVEKDSEFKELVFERGRFVYNDALDYFVDQFLTEINHLGIQKAVEDIPTEADEDYIDKRFNTLKSKINSAYTEPGEPWE